MSKLHYFEEVMIILVGIKTGNHDIQREFMEKMEIVKTERSNETLEYLSMFEKSFPENNLSNENDQELDSPNEEGILGYLIDPEEKEDLSQEIVLDQGTASNEYAEEILSKFIVNGGGACPGCGNHLYNAERLNEH